MWTTAVYFGCCPWGYNYIPGNIFLFALAVRGARSSCAGATVFEGRFGRISKTQEKRLKTNDKKKVANGQELDSFFFPKVVYVMTQRKYKFTVFGCCAL